MLKLTAIIVSKLRKKNLTLANKLSDYVREIYRSSEDRPNHNDELRKALLRSHNLKTTLWRDNLDSKFRFD